MLWKKKLTVWFRILGNERRGDLNAARVLPVAHPAAVPELGRAQLDVAADTLRPQV